MSTLCLDLVSAARERVVGRISIRPRQDEVSEFKNSGLQSIRYANVHAARPPPFLLCPRHTERCARSFGHASRARARAWRASGANRGSRGLQGAGGLGRSLFEGSHAPNGGDVRAAGTRVRIPYIWVLALPERR